MLDSPVLAVPQQFEGGTSYQVRDELENYIVNDLLGPWNGLTEQFAPRARGPRDRYLVGMLGPKHNPRSTLDADSQVPDTEPGADADGEDGELRETLSVQNAGRMWASSMGLSFSVSSDVDTVLVTVVWGHYAKVMRTTDDRTHKPVWVRNHVEHTLKLRLDGDPSARWLLPNPSPRESEEPDVAEASEDPSLRPQIVVDANDPATYLSVDVRDSGNGGHRRRVVELALINTQLEPPANPDSAWLFQPCLTVTAVDGAADIFLPADDPLTDEPVGRADLEEQHLRLLYRNQLRYANGRNVAVHVDVRPDARRAFRLTTRWLPTFDVPSTVAPRLDDSPHLAGLELSMDALAIMPAEELVAALDPLAKGYTAWLADRASDVDGLPDWLHEVARSAICRATDVASRIAEGIELLRTSGQALDGFQFANEAMALQRRRTAIAALRESEGLGFIEAEERVLRQGSAGASWRPFQLAFILLNLPALTDPAHSRRRFNDPEALVDLLFFPTGGGKTEAYLGLAAYTFAIRRLQGVVGTGANARDGRNGVTVLMRYTLRLLTAQQFQRAAALVCAAEVLRQRASDQRFGTEPFRIGLWVGGSVAPNWYSDAKQQIDEARDTGGGRRANVLQTLVCPWCGERLRGERDLKADDDERRVRVFCPRGEGADACAFSRRLNSEGLPILTVDEELYRLTPSLIVATVDKLAQLPWFGFAGMLFGRVRQRCPRHGYRHPDLDERTMCRDRHNAKGRLPASIVEPAIALRPPDLIIQDELHLISGALGTTVGLFEGAVAELSSWSVPAGNDNMVTSAPVIVASTATTKRSDAQVRALYGRRLCIFPPQVLDVADTFFSRQVPLSPDAPGRRYLGLCAHGVRLKAAEIRLAEILLLAGQTLFDRYGKPADPYLTVVGYFNATRELAGMRRYLDDDVATRVRGNGTRRGISDRMTRSRGGLLNISELTSRISSADIADVLKHLEYGFDEDLDTSIRRLAVAAEYKAARSENREANIPRRVGPDPIDIVLATSMLQVGVDVSRFGLMVVTGQPKNTAEYIQASSRVGRDASRPGLVVTLYNWSRPRDLAHFEDFEHYHATFYRQVEALSVTPYARRSIDRSAAATFIAAVRHTDDRYSINSAAGQVPVDGSMVDEVVQRLLIRAELACDGQASEYLAERLSRLRDAWAARQGGQYPLAYKADRDRQQTYVGLLDPAGIGPWGDLTVGRSMRETENEINLLVSGGDLTDTVAGAPQWSFTRPDQEPADVGDDTDGDEFGDPAANPTTGEGLKA